MLQLRLTPAIKVLSGICIAFFLYEKILDPLFGSHFVSWFGLIPAAVVNYGRFWQLVTFIFVHSDAVHLFLNVLMLVFIGSEIESVWGTKRFLKYFFFCSLSSGLVYLVLQLFFSKELGLFMPMVGASASIYGLLMAYGILFSERVLLFMMLFPMKAKHFVWLLAAMEFFTGLSSSNHLSNVAHLVGMGSGFIYLWFQGMWLLRKRKQAAINELKLKSGVFSTKSKKSAQHLKLIVDNEFESESDPNKKPKNPKTWH